MARKWKDLKGNRKKAKRFWYSVISFLRWKVWGKLNSFWWFIKYHTTHRYHIINLKGSERYEGSFRYGWIDADHAMLLANFTLLCDFVEKEDPKVGLRTLEDYKWANWTNDDIAMISKQLEDDAEIRFLYNWWTTVRPRMLRAQEECFNYESILEVDRLEDEMLLRLINIRHRLWT